MNNRTSYWIPKHSTRVFVESVDVVSGVGYDRARAAGPSASRFHDIHRVVTDLAVLGFADDGTMTLLSVHPGVSEAQVREATGFDLGTGGVPETRVPTAEELDVIRTVIDPKNLRSKEVPA